MTILFGENGAGKTGYARILKRLADVRTAEEILPNVHEFIVVVDQAATVTYSIGGDEHVLEWKGKPGVPPMTHVSVFDSPAVRIHVDDDLAYVYTPRDLALFRAVSEGIDAVKALAEEEAATKKPAGNHFLSHFARGSSVYALVETLGPASDLPALRALATLTEEQEKSIEGLRTTVVALQSESLQAQVTSTRDRLQLYADLAGAATAIAGFSHEAYNQVVAAAKAAEAEYATLRKELLATAGIGGESDDACRSSFSRARPTALIWKRTSTPRKATRASTADSRSALKLRRSLRGTGTSPLTPRGRGSRMPRQPGRCCCVAWTH